MGGEAKLLYELNLFLSFQNQGHLLSLGRVSTPSQGKVIRNALVFTGDYGLGWVEISVALLSTALSTLFS